MRFGRIRRLATSAVLLGLIGGCGAKSDHPETLSVSGKVTYKGQPVTKGTVSFMADAGQTATGPIQPDGAYRLGTFAEGDGAVAGHHKVMIIADDSDPTLMPGSSPGYKAPKDLIPKKYSKLETSGLETTVSKETKSYDFDLK